MRRKKVPTPLKVTITVDHTAPPIYRNELLNLIARLLVDAARADLEAEDKAKGNAQSDQAPR